MIRLLCTLLVTFVSISLMAQSEDDKKESPADSVQTEQTQVKTDTTKSQKPVIEKDTTKNSKAKPVIQETPTQPENSKETQKPTVEESTPENSTKEEPKIIYYQTVKSQRDDDDDDDDEYYRYSNRTVKVRDRGSRRDVKTLAGNMSHSGGFGAISFKSTELRNETIVFAGVRGGWIVNRTLGIGFEAYGAIPTAKFDDVIPENVVTLGGYGGMFLELILFSNQVVHVTFPVSGGAGYLGYYEDWENTTNNYSNDLIDEDIFWYVEPGASLELNVSRNFRLAGGVSQRFTQDLELINTQNKDFETLSYFLTLKIGRF